jgi:hypothetical protein
MSKIVSTFVAGAATLLIILAAAVSGGVTANAEGTPPLPAETTDGGGNPWHG